MHLIALKTLIPDERGAVTVDWVVLTAAITGLGIAVIASLYDGTTNLATDVANSLSNTTLLSLDLD